MLEIIRAVAVAAVGIGIFLDSEYTVRGLAKKIAYEKNSLLAYAQKRLGETGGTAAYSSVEFLALAVPAAFATDVAIAGLFIGACFLMAVKHSLGAYKWYKLGV